MNNLSDDLRDSKKAGKKTYCHLPICDLRWLPMVLFSYNRIYRDQTLSARITRGMFVASFNKFFIFKVENIVFADVFVFLHTTKTTVLSYNRLCFQVQVVRALKQFLGAFLCPVM